MAIELLLARLEGRAVTADATPDITPKPAPILACTPVTPVTEENDDTADKATGEPLPDPAMEARRQHVLAMLTERPGIRYAVVVNAPDADPVIMALAIRDVGTCELAIPAANYDALALLALIERHGATVH